MSSRAGWRAGILVAGAVAGTAAVLAAVLWGRFPLGADKWHWPRIPEPEWGRVAAPLGVFALLGMAVWAAWTRIERASGGARAGLVALVLVLGFIAQVAVGREPPAGYYESVIAVGQQGSNRYHKEARQIGRLGPLLASYERWMREKPHTLIITHPAGPVTLFWLLNHAFAGHEAAAKGFVRWCEEWLAGGLRLEEAPWAASLFAGESIAELAGVWLATLVLRLAACLVVAPVYLLARRLYGAQTGLLAAAFAAAMPSLLLFSPALDQCYPVLAATACWLGYGAGEGRSGWRAFLAGLVLSAGLFLTLAFAVVAAWAGLLGLAGLLRGEGPRTRGVYAKLLAGGALGLLLPVAGLYVAMGYDSFGVWAACWDANRAFNAASQRTYWKWVLLNPVEFLAFLGVPLACLFLGRVAGGVRDLLRGRLAGSDWATLVVAALLVALDVLGLNRGEVPRLWMFAMPACAIAGAAQIERYAPYRRAVFAGLFALQAVEVVLLKATLQVLNIT